MTPSDRRSLTDDRPIIIDDFPLFISDSVHDADHVDIRDMGEEGYFGDDDRDYCYESY